LKYQVTTGLSEQEELLELDEGLGFLDPVSAKRLAYVSRTLLTMQPISDYTE
jgi:hypothetical protein